jgi:hypothetical protein
MLRFVIKGLVMNIGPGVSTMAGKIAGACPAGYWRIAAVERSV